MLTDIKNHSQASLIMGQLMMRCIDEIANLNPYFQSQNKNSAINRKVFMNYKSSLGQFIGIKWGLLQLIHPSLIGHAPLKTIF